MTNKDGIIHAANKGGVIHEGEKTTGHLVTWPKTGRYCLVFIEYDEKCKPVFRRWLKTRTQKTASGKSLVPMPPKGKARK